MVIGTAAAVEHRDGGALVALAFVFGYGLTTAVSGGRASGSGTR